MKRYHFLTSLPRAGNTLLGCLINQNKDFCVTANSILLDVIFNLYALKGTPIYQNFPDDISHDNILRNVLPNYFSHWTQEDILIRGPWGLPANLFLIKHLIDSPKFIVLVRNPLKCLASFIFEEKPKNIAARCDYLMSDEGLIKKSIDSINEIIEKKEDYIVIQYDDLVLNSKKEIKKIYNYLEIKYKPIKTTNLKQFELNHIKYDDSILPAKIHKIRTKKIEKRKYKITDVLPGHLIVKYSDKKYQLKCIAK
tara:strand:+ start:1981 stop:2739 length:759 start_codon:yes stop_codon:yes gene_type:complete